MSKKLLFNFISRIIGKVYVLLSGTPDSTNLESVDQVQ